jgi:aspartate carbamoyltransferase catalytic subunit
MKHKSLISINDYSKEEILKIIELSSFFEKNPNQNLLQGKVVASLFFEPSTRTRLSFETAINRLGGRVVGFTDVRNTSTTKGESLKDTIKVVSSYVDLIVMRHPLEGSAKYASEVSSVPIVNAGDGSNQHPTQTLLDLYSINKTQEQMDDLNICMVGDLKYGRTIHSLLMALSHFNPTFSFVAPDELKMPDEYKEYCAQKEIFFTEYKEMQEPILDADILYMTRVQQERFSDLMEYENVKNVYTLTNDMLTDAKPNLRVLHPLPRVTEISDDVDTNSKAYYFQQAENGVYTRMAIVASALGVI